FDQAGLFRGVDCRRLLPGQQTLDNCLLLDDLEAKYTDARAFAMRSVLVVEEEDDIVVETDHGDDVGDWEDVDEFDEELQFVDFDNAPPSDTTTKPSLLPPGQDIHMQLPSPAGPSTSTTTVEATHTLRSLHGSQFWKLEPLGNVYPFGVLRKALTEEEARKKAKAVLKAAGSGFGRIWRMDAPATEEDLVKYLLRFYGDGSGYGGWQRERAVRGVKMCHYCVAFWGRDENADRNIEIIFWYMRYHDNDMPLLFRRRRVS
ncbi:hypothetical protein HDV05_006592, partial [Chytridiales sp. JEL 0842]